MNKDSQFKKKIQGVDSSFSSYLNNVLGCKHLLFLSASRNSWKISRTQEAKDALGDNAIEFFKPKIYIMSFSLIAKEDVIEQQLRRKSL